MEVPKGLMKKKYRVRTNFNLHGRLLKFVSSPFASKMSASANQLHFLVCHITHVLLTELNRSVWENRDLGRVYRPDFVRSVLINSVIVGQDSPLQTSCLVNKS